MKIWWSSFKQFPINQLIMKNNPSFGKKSRESMIIFRKAKNKNLSNKWIIFNMLLSILSESNKKLSIEWIFNYRSISPFWFTSDS
jgi:hypothetical protein